MDVLEMMPERAGEPSDKMDGPAAVGQFLREVSLVDLVVELVQNDLDAGATRTWIEFGEQGLVCEGDGEPLDAKAWARLESVIGAGGDIEAKRDGIGSKNHGLRSLFRLADRIGIQSAGLRSDLTLRGDLARPKRFKPAFWPRQDDRGAPRMGTRIIAPYRTMAIKVPDGDNTTLHPPEPKLIDDLWRGAVDDAPERFVSASRPGAPWRYTLRLSRYGQGVVDFTFECAALAGKSRGLWLRTCRVQQDGGTTRTVLRRHALRYRCKIGDGGKVPRLFRAGGRIWGELNWKVDQAGRPLPDRGRLRYPIAFTGREARSGHGFDVSAAFIAGRSRHDISADARNDELLQQGRDAFAAAGQLLAHSYGTRATGLLRGLETRDLDYPAEVAILKEMVAGGGLCSAVFGKEAVPALKGHRVLQTGATIVLPVADDTRPATLRTVAALGAAVGDILHPDTPAFVREHLLGLSHGEAAIRRFGIDDAARQVLITENSADDRIADIIVKRTAAALQALDARRGAGGIPGDLADDLMGNGILPTFDGRTVPWKRARRLDRVPPTIPGVQAPPVVHNTVSYSNVLLKGTLAVKDFRLDEYLSTLNFEPTQQVTRRKFFGWLDENALTLKAITLRRIAEKPVWPGSDGQHRVLDAYCYPKARTLRQLLASSIIAPAASTVALIESSKLPAKSPRLRGEPSDEELLGWHSAELATVKSELDLGAARARLDELERSMTWVLDRYPSISIRLGHAHETLSQAGEMVAVSALHVPSPATAACGLPATSLTRQRSTALYLRLGARPRPTPAAILTALRNDPDPQKLFVRLEAYKRGQGDLFLLAAEKILTVDGIVRAADECAFVGEPDFWGEWKVGITADGVADHHALLSQIGVTRARPTKDLSVGFFDWLSNQSRAVQQRHHPKIDRHWKEPSTGPVAWIGANQDVRCIPVTSAAKPFELVGLSTAMRTSEGICLDDFPEIRDAALASGKLRLTLIKAPGSRSPILDLLAGVGVRSLRALVGSPRAVGGIGSVELVSDLTVELSSLQTKRRLAEFRARLPLNGVAIADLRPEWQKMLKAIAGVRSRPKLSAVYRLFGRDYEVPVRSGIDRDTRLVLVAADSDRLHEMYEVIAEYLFKPGKMNAWGLLRAARDRRQLEFLATGIEETEEETEEGDKETEEDDQETSDANIGGDVEKGHGLSAAKLTPVLPDPKPLPPISTATLVPRPKRKGALARTPSQGTQSLEEEDQKRALKQEHYGYHCQACLGAMEVLKAAPPGTYVFAPGYRQRFLHAHHVQHRQNGGALGAGNLLVLCEYHHRLFGDQLSRALVLAGLAEATPLKRAFPVDEAGERLRRRSGLLARTALSAPPFEARLYFTEEHAAAWRRSEV
ncbi:hypothetical protein [Mesorhizobium sp. M7A.F.Ce.TU.012.03.2.1]|uniref:hypothetical protein n=1 Tax=Mesorhizobium sp. M7A.F.Ce.TU.012.03.2.1 TaxID=2493681 RepID=UPI000FDC02FF|nr:hypothetical protein [Mesorhizobium sp. M7A.F.Ce.TU.012.03.2.1]AZV18962.1 hypothetical protein EJ079_07530 [Mesorhizobium sp. M7A.F.Ce.TU.012.03.2.1]